MVRKLLQVPPWEGNDSGEGECSTPPGPDRSVALPMKTRGMFMSSIILVLHPEVQIVNPPLAFEVRAVSRFAILDVSTLRVVDYHVALIANCAHGREWAAYFSDLVEDVDVPAFTCSSVQCLLAHVGKSSGASRHVARTPFGLG